jgi:chromosomal replication initiation ATPase DnaA
MEAIKKIQAYFNLTLNEVDRRVLVKIIEAEKTVFVKRQKTKYVKRKKARLKIETYFAKWEAVNGEIGGKERKREYVSQRVNFSREAYKDGYSYGEIARVLGLRNHTSILHYVKRCKL